MDVLLMLGVFISNLVAGGMAYAATDLGGTAAYAVDGQIAVGQIAVGSDLTGWTYLPVAWDLSQSSPLQVNLPLDPSKYDNVAGRDGGSWKHRCRDCPGLVWLNPGSRRMGCLEHQRTTEY